MAKPPPAPPAKGARSQVEAFGQAFDAAVSHMDGSVGAVQEASAAMGGGDDQGQVYANDLEIRGVYTGPYAQVSERPPSLDHLGAPDLKTLKTVAIPLDTAVPAATPVEAASFGGILKVLLGLAVLGVGVAFALKLGLI